MQNHLLNAHVRSQREPLDNRQVANSAGGYSYEVSDWDRLQRFLILGTTGGTYYISQHDLTRENVDVLLKLLAADGQRFVNEVLGVHESGRASKLDPAIYALALAAAKGDDATRKLALSAVPTTLRTATQLFTFLAYVKTMRGLGRGLRNAISKWYLTHPNLDLQLVKYRQRNGWTHRDVLRVSHAHSADDDKAALLRWAVKGEIEAGVSDLVDAYNALNDAEDAHEIVTIISKQRVPWELIPTDYLRDADVMRELIRQGMPVGALLRQLGRLSNLGVLTGETKDGVISLLTNADAISKARIHPLAVLAAVNVYKRGKGLHGNLSWQPDGEILDALDETHELSYGNVEPTGQKIMLCLDVSGSMTWDNIAGVGGITPRDAAAAMAAMYLRTETERPHLMAFTSNLVPVKIGKRSRIDDVLSATQHMPFGRTDCSLPMEYALENKIVVDAFMVFTDNETYAGRRHPSEALAEYRRKVNPNAKLVVYGMASNGFTIADPDDAGMLDVVGMDTGVPNVVANFLRG